MMKQINNKKIRRIRRWFSVSFSVFAKTKVKTFQKLKQKYRKGETVKVDYRNNQGLSFFNRLYESYILWSTGNKLGLGDVTSQLIKRREKELKGKRIKDVDSGGKFVYNDLIDRSSQYYNQLNEILQNKRNNYLESILTQSKKNDNMYKKYLKKIEKMKKISFFSFFCLSGVLSGILSGVGFFVKRNLLSADSTLLSVSKTIVNFVLSQRWITGTIVFVWLLKTMLSDVPVLGYFVKAIPNPGYVLWNKLIYQPIIVKMLGFFSRLGGRIWGVKVDVYMENDGAIQYLYYTSNGKYKVLTEEANKTVHSILESSIGNSSKSDLIDRILISTGKDLTFYDKIKYYFNGKLVKMDLGKLTILDDYDDDYDGSWWKLNKIPKKMQDVKLPDLNNYKVNKEIDLSVLIDAPPLPEILLLVEVFTCLVL